jgi:hypothetical protein
MYKYYLLIFIILSIILFYQNKQIIYLYEIFKYSLIYSLIIYVLKINIKNKITIKINKVLFCIFVFMYILDIKYFYDKDKNLVLLQDKYYIAANLYNNEQILSTWTYEINRFIDYIGKENIYISIVENNSIDKTKEILLKWKSDLDKKGVKNNIKIGFKENIIKEKDERITYLSFLRNEVLSDLYKNHNFTKIIFLNDILFVAEDIINIISTKQDNYDMVCAFDYEGIGLYDIWVSRDINGKVLSPLYPYFQDNKSINLLNKMEPIPVYTCWNGLVVFKSEPFYRHNITFRHSEKNECYSSECFLIAHDLNLLGYNKIYMNPKIKVAYTYSYYFLWKELLNWKIIKYIMSFIKYKNELPKIKYSNNYYECIETL